MVNIALAASVAFMATSALATGSAKVVNMCSYPITLVNTPAAGGGYEAIPETLQTNGVYSQQWTELTNGQGWSIKLSKTASLEQIMQYEYTFHNDGIIWYDLSDVNGNPWDGNWEISAAGAGCKPKQQAYQYATDDAYGMQACNDAAVITVILCSGNSAGGSDSSSAADTSAVESSTVAPVTSTAAPATSAPETSAQTTAEPATTSTPQYTWTRTYGNKEAAASSPSSSLTTFATVTTSSVAGEGYDVTVTDVATAVVTQYVTATAAKRHEHHARHPHNRLA